MKMAMKLTTGFLVTALMAGAAWAQSSNAGNGATSPQTPTINLTTAPATAKPLPGAPAPAVKPAVIPDSKPAAKPAAKAVAAAPASDGNEENSQLKSVNVAHSGSDIQIEIKARGAVTPRVSKLGSPARVVVELPETAMATPQNHISVGSAGVKAVRIGTDGKNPPTTSVVVDLDQALAYDLTPDTGDDFVLTLHTQAAAKNAPAAAPAKAAAPVNAQAAKPQAVKAQTVTLQSAPSSAAPKVTAVKAPEIKPAAPAAKATVAVTPIASGSKGAAVITPAAKSPVVITQAALAGKTNAPAASAQTAKDSKGAASANAAMPPAVEAIKSPEPPKPAERKWAMTGKRDPFFSPVVQANGSGCSTGKKCLEIGQINLRGVVKSDSGFIAVVTNSLNKAYFLRENDPVFNGYVVKITGDSVVFQETVQDKLGKTFTREVVKKIFTPAV
jgi:Tfp pilus assembly protein PilP